MSGVKIAVHALYGVTGGTRIHDNQSHNLVFYQLNYGHMEQVTGFEPVLSAWQAEVLPLYYTCIWCGVTDSNRRPPACKADALTSWANPAYFSCMRIGEKYP